MLSKIGKILLAGYLLAAVTLTVLLTFSLCLILLPFVGIGIVTVSAWRSVPGLFGRTLPENPYHGDPGPPGGSPLLIFGPGGDYQRPLSGQEQM